MTNPENPSRHPQELNAQLVEENRWLKSRLDVALNTIALLMEEIQRLKDEIAILKGQKPRPKIPPSVFWKDPKAQTRKPTRTGSPEENTPADRKRIN